LYEAVTGGACRLEVFVSEGSMYYGLYLSDSAGRVQKDIYNKKGNPSYKYYYGSTPASK